MTPTIPDEAVQAMPERIYASAPSSESGCVVSFDIPSLAYDTEYVRADLALPFLTGVKVDVDALAQEIRRVDGKHNKGAGELAEALIPYLSAVEVAPSPRAQALEEGPQLYGPFGHLTGDRNLSEDTWEVYDEPAATVGDIFSIPLYTLTDPFKEIGLDVHVKADVLSPDPSLYLEMAVQVADKANKGWLKKCDVTANKKEARDYETMAIAASHISTAIRALSSQPVADGWLPVTTGLNAIGFEIGGGYILKLSYDNLSQFEAAKEAIQSHLPASPGASATRPTGGSNHGE